MEHTLPFVAIPVIIILVLIYMMRSMKRLRRMKNDLDKSWLDIELLFKHEQDELPRLIQTSRSYMPEEKRVLDSVSAARTLYQHATTAERKAAANAAIRDAVNNVFATAAKHPDLQRNNTFTQLQTRISEIEERISERCDLYDDDVNRFNARTIHFPSSIPARLAGLKPRPLYRIESTQQSEK
jgi:LemA protein